MASNSVGTASIEIEADADGLDSDIAREARKAGDKGGKEFNESFKSSSAASVLGNFIGGALLNAVGAALGGVKALIGDALSQSDAIDKFKATLNFAGLDTGAIESLTASTKAYADQTVYGLSDIQSITAQLAANGVAGFDTLAQSAGNLNAIAGGNAETFKSVGMVLTQTAGSGKLVTENWNQLANAIPGASGILQKALLAAGAYTGNFRDAMAKGEISAEEFNAAISLVGNDPIAVEAARSTATFEGAVGNLQASLLTLTTNLVDKVKPGVTGVISGLGDGLSTVANFVAGINSMSDVLTVFEDLSGMRDNLITGILMALPGIVEAIAAFIPSAITTVISSAITMWTGIITALTTAIPLIIKVLAAAIPQILTALVTAIPIILNGALTMFTAIITALVTIIPQIITTLITLIPQIIGSLLTALPAIIAGAIALFMGIIQGIITAVPLIIAAVVALLPVLASSLLSMLPDLIEAALTLFLALVEGVVGAAPQLIIAIVELLPQIANTLLGMLPTIISSAITLFLGLVTGILGALPDIIVGLLEILPSLIGTLLGMGPRLITAAIALFLGLVEGIIRATPVILQAIAKMLIDLVVAVVEAAPKLLEAGKQAIQGFIDGIKSMAATVFNAAVNVVKGAIDGIKNFLGIASPSKLLKGMGKNTMTGYIDGVDSLAAEAQKSLLAATSPPIPPGLNVSASALGRVGATNPDSAGSAASTLGGNVGGSTSTVTVEAGAVQVVGPDPYRAALEVGDRIAERIAA